jgi:hypothetical protein
MAIAEKFFVETIGISRFLQMDNLAAKDTEGTSLRRPGNWVCNHHIAYAGDTQIELIRPVSGARMFQESLDRHGDAVQHLAYWLDDADGSCSLGSRKKQLIAVGIVDLEHVVTPPGFLARNGALDDFTTKICKPVRGQLDE